MKSLSRSLSLNYVCVLVRKKTSCFLVAHAGAGRKPSPILEQSSMVVETVDKKPGQKATKKFRGDASKVVARGPGIKKAFLNRAQNITLEIKDAGTWKWLFFVRLDHLQWEIIYHIAYL